MLHKSILDTKRDKVFLFISVYYAKNNKIKIFELKFYFLYII